MLLSGIQRLELMPPSYLPDARLEHLHSGLYRVDPYQKKSLTGIFHVSEIKPQSYPESGIEPEGKP